MYIPFIGVRTAASSLQTGYRSPYLLITHKKCEDWNHLTYSPGLGLCAWDFLCAVSCIKQELESITPIKPIPSCQWTLHDKITNLTSRIWQLKIWWFGFVKLAIIIAEHFYSIFKIIAWWYIVKANGPRFINPAWCPSKNVYLACFQSIMHLIIIAHNRQCFRVPKYST